MQLSLWGDEQPPPVENFIECIHFDGSREVVSTLDPLVDWCDNTVHSAGFVTRKVYEEYLRGIRDATRK